MGRCNCIITKQSLRTLLKRSRLPARIDLFLAGGWLHDLLKANNLTDKYPLYHMAYQVQTRSISPRLVKIMWKEIST